ncbi:MAG: hypothetical protein HY276_13425 [Ignavibacteriales bacterium]|nr:hypothetical protein [Ignavibacteriales bacterium]
MNGKRIIAREWLIFVVMMVFGFFFMPQFKHLRYLDFWESLWGYRWATYWLEMFKPYLGLQLIRSVIWSVLKIFFTDRISNKFFK